MRISKITLKDFRGFPGEYEFVLGEPGKNLLIHGENGAGKSSLFHALDQFLQASRTKVDITSYRNIFIETAEPFVKLEIVDFNESGDRVDGSGTYEWSVEANPENQVLIEEAAKTRGCLDYKSLLQTHFVHLKSDSVDIFPLLIGSLLVHFENPISKRLFGEEWKLIQDKKGNKLTQREREELIAIIEKFNQGLQAVIPDLAKKANELLAGFGHNINIDLVPDGSTKITFRPKNFFYLKVHLQVTYAGEQIMAHHRFLNEARLSAIAIVLYLASLLLNPTSQMKIIVLDDVLIGLDMSNRMPVLNILRQYFADWQLIILTHDRVWYDMVRHQTKEVDWCYYELHCGRDVEAGFDRPYSRAIKEGWNHLLQRARHHLEQHDERAAAVYARAAFEYKIKKYCDDKGLHIQYAIDSSKVKAEWFWKAITNKLAGNITDPVKKIIADIETYRRVVLNPFSHETAAPVVRAEIEGAINAVEALRNIP
jgi:hypothetical protein